MPRPLAPEVQVGQSVAVCLDRVSHFLGHTPIRTHVQQNCASVSNQAKRPVCDNARANDAHDRILKTQRKNSPAAKPAIANTETTAASTCTNAARMLSSRCPWS